MTEPMKLTYIIKWTGEPIEARYLRLRRLASEKKNWTAVRTIEVNPVSAERVGLNVMAANAKMALRAHDSNPTTVYALNGDMAFDRRKDAQALTLLASRPAQPMTVVQLDATGKELSRSEVTTAYSKTAFLPETARVVVSGHADIYEAIQ